MQTPPLAWPHVLAHVPGEWHMPGGGVALPARKHPRLRALASIHNSAPMAFAANPAAAQLAKKPVTSRE